MVMTLREIYTAASIIEHAIDSNDLPTARHEARKLAEFLQNAHIIPILTTEQTPPGGF